ncbi:MAG: hypothetical protein Q4A97_04720 [Comamonadaceae bacterium]|nr:hypothetical protein [Comamonadaceae bacterium]
MKPAALEVQSQELFEQEILNIDDHLAACLAKLGDMKRKAEQIEAAAQQPKSFFSRLFGRHDKTQTEQPGREAKAIRQAMWDLLGINAWANTLYYHFDNE